MHIIIDRASLFCIWCAANLERTSSGFSSSPYHLYYVPHGSENTVSAMVFATHVQTKAIQICQQENMLKELQWAKFYPEVNTGAASTLEETLASQFSHLNRIFGKLFLGFEAFVLNTNELWFSEPSKNALPKSLQVWQIFESVSSIRSFHFLTVLCVHVVSFQSVKFISHENKFFRFLLKKI